jgi:hypothetical protein
VPYRIGRHRRARLRLQRRDRRLAVSAMIAGLALAVIAGHAAGAGAGAVAGAGARAGGAQMAGTARGDVALGERMAAARGWTGGQWDCLNWLWTRESGWSVSADTRRSGLDPAGAAVYAYGIPQARPAQKMAAAGADWATDPATQIRWGLGYIAATYGTPCGAWAHETADGWY